MCSAQFKTFDRDFLVTEELGWRPQGEGEHVYLDITKKGENTRWVAKKIAEFAGVKEHDVGFCGLKDRNAVTRQWFSVYGVKNPSLDWCELSSMEGLEIEVHEVTSGIKKLRRGDHECNRFEICLRGLGAVDKSLLQERAELISVKGVPNYFGEQRFGRDGNNLTAFASRIASTNSRLHARRDQFLVSAARSWLFNVVLSSRVKDQNWRFLLDGDTSLDEHPSGPLWGRGRPRVTGKTLEVETQLLQRWQDWCEALEHVGLSQDRRSLCLTPKQMSWCWEGDIWTVSFSLPPGTFATVVLRELFELVSSTE